MSAGSPLTESEKIALEAHVELNQLVTESSLEDIFLQLTEGPKR